MRGFGFTIPAWEGDLAELDRRLAVVAGLGCAFAELPLYAEHVVVGGRPNPGRTAAIAEVCARHPLRYTVHGTLWGNLMDAAHGPEHEAVTRGLIEAAAVVGADVLVVHSGRLPTLEPAAIAAGMARERDALRRLGDLAGARGVTLALENLFAEPPRFAFSANLPRLAEHIEAVAHPRVVGTLDFSHARIQAAIDGLDYAAGVRRFAPVAGHLHVHDSFGRPKRIDTWDRGEDAALGQGDLHLPLGWGDMPWDDILPGLPVRPGATMIVELPLRHWAEIEPTRDRARDLLARVGA